MDVEILTDPDMARRGRRMLEAMIDAAEECGIHVIANDRWKQAAPILMTYGLGHRVRRHWTEAHREHGGTVVGWDLGYWDRDESNRAFKMRVTIDEDHPWRLIATESPQRFAETGIQLREDAKPGGHVIVVGMGRKQRVWKGHVHLAWEREQIKRARVEFPNRKVVYRPKRPEYLPGTPTIDGPIEDALRGASLVVCHHSNVAVDACIAGVPVRCQDGAAYALYRDTENPTREQRQAFLESLAHWQYSPREAVAAWTFIKRKLAR